MQTTIQDGNVIFTQTIPTAEYAVTVQNNIEVLQSELINQNNVLLSLQDQVTKTQSAIADTQSQIDSQNALLTQLQ